MDDGGDGSFKQPDMRLPDVSVVMSVRNAQRTLPRAIQSILDQTLPNWELIAIDDGSTDDTPAILHQFATADPRIQFVTATDRGLVGALNQALKLARADLIARMDADDVSRPNRLQIQVAYLARQSDLGVVGCRVEFGGDRERSRGYALHVDWLNTVISPKQIALNRFVESPLANPSVIFRRALIDQHGGYADGPFPEDYELWLRWLDASVRMAKTEETLLTWNDPPDRLTRTDPRYDTEAFFRIKARYLAKELKRTLKGRELWIWGAGRPTRRRAEMLGDHGLSIAGYIDVDPAKTGNRLEGRPVIGPRNLPPPDAAMVIGYVASRGARELIRAELVEGNFVEGRDFWMAA